jgi:hypothetical protein
LAVEDLSAYETGVPQKQESFDGQEGREAARVNDGRRQSAEIAHSKEDERQVRRAKALKCTAGATFRRRPAWGFHWTPVDSAQVFKLIK